MTCPDELTLAMYVDTELDAAARDRVRSHTAHCPRCAAAVRALDDEAVVIRDVLSEPGAETETVPPAVVSHVRRSAQRRVLGSFAAAIGLAAGALELGAVAVARLEPSALLEWLSPFHLSGQMNFLFRAAFYGAREGGAMLSTMMTTAAVTVATLMVLTVVLRLARGVARPAATGLLTWALLWSAVPSEALEIRRSGDVTVAASETVDETVVAMADTITVDGTIRGDLIAMSRRVRIRGTVEGNLFALAQQVEVDGEVHGAIFGFGQTVSTQGRADGSLYALGQTVSLAQGSHVEGDVMMFGADATVEGTVGRDVTAFGQRVGIEGHVGRGATVGGQRVVIASRARIGGPLTAYVPTAESVDVAAGATIGGGTDVRVVESEATRSRYLTGGFYLGQLLRLGAAFVTGLLLFWVAPGAAAVRFETPVAARSRPSGLGSSASSRSRQPRWSPA